MKIAAVVPTCRGFEVPHLDIPVTWIIVHDRELWPVKGEHIDILAPEPAFYGSHCDSIRSAGFLYALNNGYDYILTVDDDCVIPHNWATSHLAALKTKVHPWSETVRNLRTRGCPIHVDWKTVGVSHGLWDGVPDLSATDQSHRPQLRIQNDGKWHTIHPPFPQSSMNFGFPREVGVVMYQPAQGPTTPFDRLADIWGGLIAQRCLWLHGYAFMNGGAIVYHERASNLAVNLVKEAPGVECHETFWKHVWNFTDKGSNLMHTYAKMASHIGTFPPRIQGNPTPPEWHHYFTELKNHMFRWIDEVTP